MVCNRANICIPESSKWRFHSNETLSLTSESVEISYWLKSYFRLIRATPHFSSVQFYDKNRPFEMTCCFKCPALIFRMTWVCEVPCWNHISGWQTLAYWQFPPLHYTDVFLLDDPFKSCSELRELSGISRSGQILHLSSYYTSWLISLRPNYHYK